MRAGSRARLSSLTAASRSRAVCSIRAQALIVDVSYTVKATAVSQRTPLTSLAGAPSGTGLVWNRQHHVDVAGSPVGDHAATQQACVRWRLEITQLCWSAEASTQLLRRCRQAGEVVARFCTRSRSGRPRVSKSSSSCENLVGAGRFE